jgi:hypothetical protein
MRIIGCDFHPSFQQIAMVDTETGEQTERRIAREEAAEFLPRIIGLGASRNGSQWEHAVV